MPADDSPIATTQDQTKGWQPIYQLILVQQAIAASTHLIAKLANQNADPFTIVFVRGIITVLTFSAVMYFQRSSLKPIQREDWNLIIFLGLLNIPCNQVLFVGGLKYTVPPNAALAYALVPAFVLVFSYFFYHEKVSAKKVLGIGIAFLGTLLVLFERGIDFGSDFFLGNMMELSAAVSWTWYSLLGKRLVERYGAMYSTALTMISGMVWYSVIFPFLPVSAPLSAVSWQTFLLAAYLGVFASVIGYWLWYYALERIPASNVAVFSNLQPIMVTIFSVIFLGTSPTLIFYCGGALVLCGVLLTQRG